MYPKNPTSMNPKLPAYGFQFAASRGFSLIEALVGAAIISAALLALSSVSATLQRISTTNRHQIRTAYLLEEGMEVARYLRDKGWDQFTALTPGVAYQLAYAAGDWSATTTAQVIDATYTRTVTITPVLRDASQHIVLTGGTLDQETKKVVVAVTWNNRGATTTQSATTYLAKIF